MLQRKYRHERRVGHYTMLTRIQIKLKRLAAVVPVLAGALVVTALLSLIAWALLPYAPPGLNNFVANFASEGFETHKNELKNWFDGFGESAFWMFLALQFLQVVVAPIPGQLIGIAGGFVFGFWKGLCLNVAGNMLGSFAAMLMTRFLGEKVMRPFVPASLQERFDGAISRGGLENFFMLFLLPGTPKDSICFMAGLTRFNLWALLGVNTLGRLPGLAVLTFTGAGLNYDLGTVQWVFSAGLALAFVVWLFDEELKEHLRRLGT
jgi:uncharacterized membrane protein YdjX (TVP38/TMEM64 family)